MTTHPDLAARLMALGFTPLTDFVAQDDGDGPYIAEWLSEAPQPTEAEIAAAVVPEPAPQTAAEKLAAYLAANPDVVALIGQ